MITTSLVIATYNWPAALELCLLSVLRQSELPNEVIIADDGSTEETKKLIQKYQEIFPVPLKHLWQPDEGFQLSKVRNKAIAAASNEYILQVDGDVILHKFFIKDHLHFARKDSLLQGSRVMLGPVISKRMLGQKQTDLSLWSNDIKRKENGVRAYFLTNIFLYRFNLPSKKPAYMARGANMSFWKKDFIAVNGYDENFVGWGHEDSDFTLRMMSSGKKKLYFKFAGIIYHLYHKEAESKEKEQLNASLLKQTESSGRIQAVSGVSQYL
jgi:glycosyltransferase involved in cell wall biosynthesis